MTPCKKYNNLIFKLLDGDISQNEKETIDSHMSHCNKCSDALSALQQMKYELLHMPALRVGDEFHIILRDKIRKNRQRNVSFDFSVLFPRWTAIPAIGLGIVLAAIIVWRGSGNSSIFPHDRVQGELVAEYMNDSRPDQVYYVIEDNPESILLSREDRTSGDSSRPDSSAYPDNRNFRSRAAHVSF